MLDLFKKLAPISRKDIREYRAEQRRMEFVEVRRRGGGIQECQRRRIRRGLGY